MKRLTLNHKEFVTDLSYSIGFGETNITQYDVNPGLANRFPWLSGLSQQFESYRFTKLNYVYVPNVGTSEQGAIALCPDYDPADDNTSLSKSELFSFEDTKRGPLWAPLTMACSPHNLAKRKTYFVRGGPLAANLDIKTYDALSLTIMLNHTPEQIVLGELWVDYTIVLETPQLGGIQNLDSQTDATYHLQDYPFEEIYAPTTIKGLMPVKVGDFDELSVKKAGTFLYHLYSYFDCSTATPSVVLPSFGGGAEHKFINAAFENPSGTSYEFSQHGAVDFGPEAEDWINGVKFIWEGYNNANTTDIVRDQIVFSPISRDFYKTLYGAILSDNKTKIKLKSGQRMSAIKRKEKERKRKEKTVDSVSEPVKPSILEETPKIYG